MNTFIMILSAALLLWVCIVIWRKEESQLRAYYWPALVVKLAAGISLGLIYKYHYEGDTFVYFEDATRMARLALTDPGAYVHFLLSSNNVPVDLLTAGHPRATFFVKLASVACMISGGNYWVCASWLSLLSFLACWRFARQITARFHNAEGATVFSFLLFPSVVFWSSGLIKESLATAAIFIMCTLILQIWFRERPTIALWLLGAVSTYLLWNLKYYEAGVFFPVAAAGLAARHTIGRGGFGWQLAAFSAFLVFLVVGIVQLHPNFGLVQLPQVIASNYQAFARISNPGDMIIYHDLAPTWSSLIAHAPKAAFSGLLRPFLWESGNFFQLMSSVEGLVTFLLILSALWWRVKSRAMPEYPLLLAAVLVYAIELDVFITLSTPNFGTLVRYRIAYMPFVLFMSSYGNRFFDAVYARLKGVVRL